MPRFDPRRTALFSFAFVGILAVQVASRLLSGRDQDSLDAMFEAVAGQTGWYAMYAIGQIGVGLALPTIILLWTRWQGHDRTVPKIALGLGFVAGVYWEAGGLCAFGQVVTTLGDQDGGTNMVAFGNLEAARAVLAKIGMSLGGVSVLLLALGSRLQGFGRIAFGITAAISGLAGLGIWLEGLPFHRVLGSLYTLWFIASGLIALRLHRSGAMQH